MTKASTSISAKTLQPQTYLVGGAVRDKLLGIAVYDRDWVVVGATVDDLLNQGYQQVGADFPCFLHPETKEEYSLARTERKQGKGYTGFVCDFGPDITLEEDLSRRDLTINAIAQDQDGELIDPYGGQQDIHDKWLRHVSPAFAEDPLRVLRVARFAARFAHRGFRVHHTTLVLMKNISASGELKTLTAERVWKELSRALAEPTPTAFFETLRDGDALAKLLPEVDALYGVPQTEQHHPEIDTGIHTMMCVDYAAKNFADTEITFAALFHDLGKGITPPNEWPRHIMHEIKGVPLVKKACKRLRAPKSFQQLAELVCQHHLRCHRALEMKPATVVKMIHELDGIRRPERFDKFLKACESDARGRLGFEQTPYPQADYLSACLQQMKKVNVKALVEEGFKGEALGEAVRKAQSQRVAELDKSSFQPQ